MPQQWPVSSIKVNYIFCLEKCLRGNQRILKQRQEANACARLIALNIEMYNNKFLQ